MYDYIFVRCLLVNTKQPNLHTLDPLILLNYRISPLFARFPKLSILEKVYLSQGRSCLYASTQLNQHKSNQKANKRNTEKNISIQFFY